MSASRVHASSAAPSSSGKPPSYPKGVMVSGAPQVFGRTFLRRMGNHFHESAAKLHMSMTAAATAAIFFHRCLVETSSGDGGTAGRSDGKDWSSGSSSKRNGGSGSSSNGGGGSSSSSRPSSSSTPSSSKPSCVMPRCLEKYDAYVVAATCLFLASKVVEEPRRIRDVLNTTHHVRHPDRAPLLLDQEFSARREAIVACEQSVLRALAFDTEAETAYPALATLAETIGLGPTVLRLAHSLANDGLRCRRLIARTRPLLLAVGCVYVALSVAAGEGAEEKDEREEGDRLRAQQEQGQRQKDGPAPGVNQEMDGRDHDTSREKKRARTMAAAAVSARRQRRKRRETHWWKAYGVDREELEETAAIILDLYEGEEFRRG